MNKSPRTQEEIAPYQAVSAVLTFLRLFIQESVAVCMNNHTGQTSHSRPMIPFKGGKNSCIGISFVWCIQSAMLTNWEPTYLRRQQ